MRIVLIILLLANLLFADHNDDDREKIHMPYDMHYLDLSAKQQKYIYNLLLTYREKRRTLHKKRETLEHTTSKLFTQEHFDKQVFIQLQLQLKKELLQIEADFLEDLHSVLSTKQRKMFVNYLKEWESD